MILSDIATKARSLVNADTSSYTNANLLIDLNMWYHKVVTMILQSQDEWDYDDARNTDFPILSTSLVENPRDYSIPVSEKVLKLKSVNISYDGTNFYKATPIDSGEFTQGVGLTSSSTQEATVDGRFDKTSPRYDMKYGSIFVYPRANATDVANGGKIVLEWTRQITEITSAELTTGTVVLGFDDPFHPMVAYGCAFEFAISKGLPNKNDLFTVIQDYEARLKDHYSSKQKDREYNVRSAIVSYK
jgi:hypothetical protein